MESESHGGVEMIDLDELERKRAAAEKQLAQREAGGVYLYESDVDAYTNA